MSWPSPPRLRRSAFVEEFSDGHARGADVEERTW
jgi:hypothetical protein